MDFEAFTDGLDHPMYVVTVMEGGERSGCLVGFGSQVSMEPPRFLVCISVANHTHPIAQRAGLLAVHLLGPEQHALAELFGTETGDDIDKFQRCSWQAGPGGVPVLDDCPRVLIGRAHQQLDLGDHTGFVLDPVSVTTRDGDPGLTFQDVEHLDPGHPS
jgi:flavin reductase (DIM6/NTAB) family NADH-FMN oxidoreductase RutF